ncbi:MAG: hypothetical protein SGI86_23100 [Deltaproteobacteria bacterium]|nr:hypothetical protein [Deltaproteobacteria bacterium]
MDLRRSRLAVLLVAALVLLAIVESVNAITASLFAPSEKDWQAVASAVKAEFKEGDLVVAAPAWADPVMRLHMGDLLTPAIAARLDDDRFGRVWQVAQRGARTPEVRGTLAQSHRYGALTLERYDRKPAKVHFDFVAAWHRARVVRREPGRGELDCPRGTDRFACPNLGFNFVKPEILEIGHSLRQALYAQPVGGATVVIEFGEPELGSELVVAAGLHHVWFRKAGDGDVVLRVFIGGHERLVQKSDNASGWQRSRIDTADLAGTHVPVRFEITSERPFARHFGFAAEARSP